MWPMDLLYLPTERYIALDFKQCWIPLPKDALLYDCLIKAYWFWRSVVNVFLHSFLKDLWTYIWMNMHSFNLHGGIVCYVSLHLDHQTFSLNVCHLSVFQTSSVRSVYIIMINYSGIISAKMYNTFPTIQHAM